MVMAQLAMARRAKLHVAGINVESCAIVECFARLFRRANDQKRAILFVDLGQSSTQAVLSRGNRITFARDLPIAGEQLDQAVAEGMGIDVAEAHRLRLEAAGATATAEQSDEVSRHLVEPIDTLGNQLVECLHYYESVFRSQDVERVIFLGGQATDRRLCQALAQRVNLPAQIGDPLVRIGSLQAGGLNAGLDRREPQPRWAVAVGLSLSGMRAA